MACWRTLVQGTGILAGYGGRTIDLIGGWPNYWQAQHPCLARLANAGPTAVAQCAHIAVAVYGRRTAGRCALSTSAHGRCR